jgi:hypothetical protein
LAALVKEAKRMNCVGICPLAICLEPTGAHCEATATTGNNAAYACRVTIAGAN